MQFFQQGLFSFIFSFAHRNGLLDAFGIFVAEYLAYCLVMVFGFFVWKQKTVRLRIAFFIEASMAILVSRGIVTELIRFFYHHPRPFQILGIVPLLTDNAYSFPSGHAAVFFALSAVVFFWNKKWGGVFFACSLLMGIALIFVGVHWPLDIVGGIVVGVVSAWGVRYLLRPYLREITTPIPSSTA